MVRFEKSENDEKDGTKVRRAVYDYRSHQTSDLPVETPSNVEDS